MQLTRSIFGQTARIALSQSCISKMGLKVHEFGNQQHGKGAILYNMLKSQVFINNRKSLCVYSYSLDTLIFFLFKCIHYCVFNSSFCCGGRDINHTCFSESFQESAALLCDVLAWIFWKINFIFTKNLTNWYNRMTNVD